MCLIAFSYKENPVYKLILLANRDEFFARPTRPAQFDGDLLAGKDLQEGGTWLGLSRKGRVAAVTNFRTPPESSKPLKSRGLLISDFLNSNCSVHEYIEKVSAERDCYFPFNLLLYDGSELFYYSSTLNKLSCIESGIHALSNHHIDSNWPKVNKVKHSLEHLLANNKAHCPEDFLEIMEDPTPAEESLLPKTGVSLEWERKLSPIFIKDDGYGTRSTAVLLVEHSNRAHFIEKSHYANRRSAITCNEFFIFEKCDSQTSK